MTWAEEDWTQDGAVAEADPEAEGFAGESDEAPEAIRFVPFPYQQDAFDRAFEAFDAGKRSVLVTMATGLGKSCLAGMVAREVIARGGRALVIAHRDELLEGLKADLAFVGVDSAIEKAEQHAQDTIAEAAQDIFHPRDIRCVVASVQTMRGKRLESWRSEYFDIVITDEAHHSVKGVGPKKKRRTIPNQQYAPIYRQFSGALRMGLTATPDRKDEGQLGYWYETHAYEYLYADAASNGDLARIEVAEVKLDIDLSKVREGVAGLNQGDLEDAVSPHLEKMVRAVKEQIGDRKFIAFCPGRESKDDAVRPCQLFAKALSEIGIPTESIWGDHPDRVAINRRFREGEFQGVCNADLYNEGVNFPFVSAIVEFAPTESEAVFMQRMGRGTRKLDGKPNCLLVIFNWKFDASKLGLVRPYSLVKPRGSDLEAKIARQIIASGEETDLLKVAALAEERAVAEAERLAAIEAEKEAAKAKAEEFKRLREEAAELKRQKLERQRLALNVTDGASGAEVRRYDPFASPTALAGLKVATPEGFPAQRPSEKQATALADFGMERRDAMAMSATEAKVMQGWLYKRHSENKATWRQYKELLRLGIAQAEAVRFTKPQAGLLIDKYRSRRSG